MKQKLLDILKSPANKLIAVDLDWTLCEWKFWEEEPKPTDIWTNIYNWIPREECHNYKYDKEWNIIDKHCHHDSARRWSSTWTQWKKNAYERSKIPFELYKEILDNI